MKRVLTVDTLSTKRLWWGTQVYKNSVRLSNSSAKQVLSAEPLATKKYQWGRILRPAAPVAIVGGISLMYLGIKGKAAIADVDGQPYPYTHRSLPITLGGLSLLAAGICFMESSSELLQHSVEIHNKSMKKMSYQYGITPQGSISMAIKF